MANILVIGAHNDDPALGMAGTIAEHVDKSDKVTVLIGSFGELSHPHLKPEIIKKTRVKEAQKSYKHLGVEKVLFLGLKDGFFKQDLEKKNKLISKALKKQMTRLKPSKVYITAPEDLHPDHKEICKYFLKIYDKLPDYLRTDVYAYYVYPIINKPKRAMLLVDISNYIHKKNESIKMFTSQIGIANYTFTNNLVYMYNIIINKFAGFKKKTKYVEKFHKLR